MTTTATMSTFDALANYVPCVFDLDDLVEVRSISGDGKVLSRWWQARELASKANALRGQNQARRNIYVGVNPRKLAGVDGVIAKFCTDAMPCGKCARCVAIYRCLFVDFDQMTVEAVRAKLAEHPLPAPTLLVNSGHGVHAYWKLAAPITDANVWRGRMDALIALLKSDSKCSDPPRILRLPGFDNVKGDPVPCCIVDCDPQREYDLVEFPEPKPRAIVSRGKHSTPTGDDAELAIAGLARLNGSHVNDYGTWVDVGMILHSVDQSDAMMNRWDQWSQQSDKYQPGECEYKWGTFNANGGKGMGSLIKWVREATGDESFGKRAKAAQVQHSQNCETSDVASIEAKLREQAALRTDVGLAARFVLQHGCDVRWVGPWGKFIVWTGKRWEVDERELVTGLAIKTMLAIFDEAKAAPSDSEREELGKFAGKSQRRERIAAMLALVKPHLAIMPSELEANTWAFNVRNGTLNLRTGELREHRREDFCTKLAGCEYHADAKCPLTEKFLRQILKNDDDLLRYVLRFHGYCLTGDISEQVLPVYHGGGSNGKNTLNDTIAYVMGEYADAAPPDLLMQRKYDEHPTEVAGLDGKRLIIASESEKNRKLKVGLMKRLTGDETLKGRFMRGDFFSFTRRFKVILVTNNKPRVDESTAAVWRRLRLVPFNVTIPDAEQDKRLTEKLKAEAPGILAWLVRECLAWQREGMSVPKAVEEATLVYKKDSDPLGPFIDECCTLQWEGWTLSKALRAAYVAWCEERGDRPIGGRDFTDALLAINCVPVRKYTGRGWQGIAISDEGGMTP